MYLIRRGTQYLQKLSLTNWIPEWSHNTAMVFPEKDFTMFSQILGQAVRDTRDVKSVIVENYAEYNNAIKSIQSYWRGVDIKQQQSIVSALTIMFRMTDNRKKVQADLENF